MKYRQPVSMPSSVSTWLNEQLEARGIDSEVYTHYILSLLHANTLDILHPEEDDLFEIKKEGRRNAVTHRRFRRASLASTLWWRHARYEADDRIKRSAAVKCLKSAVDQNCEIESLVNELCEKLKQVDAPSKTDQSEENETFKSISRKELAEKYYAAFPPLRADSEKAEKVAKNDLCQSQTNVWVSPKKTGKTFTTPQHQNKSSHKKRYPPKNKNKMEGFRTASKSFQGPYRGYSKEQKEQIKKLEKEMMENFNTWQFLNNFSLEERDQCLEGSNTTLPDEHEDIDMYDSLPVNLSNLLDDPNDNHVDMMNNANIRQPGKHHNFLPCGTNIVSSIWSNEDNSGPKSDLDLALDFEFGTISLDGNQKNAWPEFNKPIENNFTEPNSANSSVFAGFRSLPADGVKSDFSSTLTENNECLFDMLTISLMKINHNKEKSGFTPVVPRTQTFSKLFNPFGNYPNPTIPLKNVAGQVNDQEDLLTSEKSHFQPIKATEKHGQYQDGASFVINGNLDKVEYTRSPSGTMYLEQEFGQSKKYREYRGATNAVPIPPAGTAQSGGAGINPEAPPFVPKFCMDQNDVGCQTEQPAAKTTAKCADLAGVTGDDVANGNCTCGTECGCDYGDQGLDKDKRFGGRRRRDSIIEEVSWPYEAKSCDKCNNNNETWNMDWLNGTGQDSWKDMENSKNIWNGGEVCQACLRLNGGRTPQTDQHTKLKEDILQDGEQLLSDISSLQKSYMEMSMPIELVALEPLSDKRKRRHSYIDNATDDIWGFATRFQEDCVFKMWTLPTLRSVTL